MRRTLVLIAMLGALGVLVLRSWPAAHEPEAKAVIAEAPGPVIHLAGTRDTLDEQSCAGPAIRELRRHPHWMLTLQERVWDDVVDDTPDETLATARISEIEATWIDGDLPQTLALDAQERSDLLAALDQSCAQPEPGPGDGYSGHYITISYGRVPNTAIKLPSKSRAAVDVLAVLDHVRVRYVQARLDVAHTMTLTLTGPRRDDNRWRPYTLMVRADGHIVEPDGAWAEPLAATDLVDVLDWAEHLPAGARGPRPLTGTLQIAGSVRTVAFQLDDLQGDPSVFRSPWLNLLMRWWRINLGR
jgi:hypothetical protein